MQLTRRLEREREDEEKKRQEVQRMKEISEKAKKEKERLLEKKKSLELTEDNLNEQEEKARQKLSVADELLKMPHQNWTVHLPANPSILTALQQQR